MYTTQGKSARKFVIVTMIEPILWLILVHLLSPLWKYGILFLQNIQSEGGTPMDRFEQAPPHCLAFGQYGEKSRLWRMLFDIFCILRRQIGYFYTVPSSITAVAVSFQTPCIPADIGGW